MKTKFRFILSFLLLASVSLLLQQCKSPKQENETTIKVDADTTNIDEAEEISADSAKTKLLREPLTLIIKNLESVTAPVIVGVYGTKNDFPNPKDQLKEYKFKPHGNQLTAQITNLKFGTYAIAIYQDENSDGKIDKNFIGIPTERYAFSNNYKPTVKAPSFDDCKFEYTAKSNTVNMAMLK